MSTAQLALLIHYIMEGIKKGQTVSVYVNCTVSIAYPLHYGGYKERTDCMSTAQLALLIHYIMEGIKKGQTVCQLHS